MTGQCLSDEAWWLAMTDDDRDAMYASAINGKADDYGYLDDETES